MARDMLHKEFWGLLFLVFVAWIFMAVNGSTRIERGCRPIGWAGNVTVSLTALVLPSEQTDVQRWMQKAEYSCQYAVWRLIYQADYNRAIAQQAIPSTLPPAQPPGDESVSSQRSAEGRQ